MELEIPDRDMGIGFRERRNKLFVRSSGAPIDCLMMSQGDEERGSVKEKTLHEEDCEHHVAGGEDMNVGADGVASAVVVGDDGDGGACAGCTSDINEGIGELGDGTTAVVTAATIHHHDGVVSNIWRC